MALPDWLSFTRPLAQSEPVTNALFQYGAIGVIATLALLGVRVLYRQLQDAHERAFTQLRDAHERGFAQLQESHAALVLKLTEARDRERERGDGLKEELRQQTATIQDKYMVTLSEATRIIADALRYNRGDR